MKGLKGMKHMKEIRTRHGETRFVPAGRTETPSFMVFIRFMPFMHGGSRG
jgi:hypothetical protein